MQAIITRETQAEYWKNKTVRDVGAYWDSDPGNNRSVWFAEYLKQYDFSSVFEIGFFSGRNLWHIQRMFPKVTIAGLEVNRCACNFAKEKLQTARLYNLDVYDAEKIEEKYDIVFTSGVLIHILPKDIGLILKKCMLLAKKYIIHIESIGPCAMSAGPAEEKPFYKISDQIQWRQNLLVEYSYYNKLITINNIPKSIKTNGATDIVVVRI